MERFENGTVIQPPKFLHFSVALGVKISYDDTRGGSLTLIAERTLYSEWGPFYLLVCAASASISIHFFGNGNMGGEGDRSGITFFFNFGALLLSKRGPYC